MAIAGTVLDDCRPFELTLKRVRGRPLRFLSERGTFIRVTFEGFLVRKCLQKQKGIWPKKAGIWDRLAGLR